MNPDTPNNEVPEMITKSEKDMAVLAHLLPLFVGFWAPLIIFLMNKDESVHVAKEAKESLNFAITMAIALIVAWLLCFVVIGFLLLPVVGIAVLVFTIIATIQAKDGVPYRYPINIRFIS